MEYAQLNEDGTYSHQITTRDSVEWDANNYCTAAALVKDGKADQFRVVELDVVAPPLFDPLTQAAVRDGAELVDGRWRYKWRVDALTPEQAAAKLAGARSDCIEQIKQIRDAKTQQGGYFAAGKWFHSDVFSRTQQIGLVMMGPSVPDGLQWKTMDGTFVTMTPTLASQIFAAAAAQDAGMFAHSEALQAQVNAAADPSTVDINAGWPTTFA